MSGEKVKLPVLSAQLLSDQDKAKVAVMLSKFSSPLEAKHRGPEEGFGVRVLDAHGRACVLVYKGLEVALIFQRRAELVDTSLTKAPTVRLRSLDEAWIMVNLLGNTDTTAAFNSEMHRQQLEVTQLRGLVASLERENAIKTERIAVLDNKAITQLETIKSLRAKLYPTPAKKKTKVTVKQTKAAKKSPKAGKIRTK